MKKHPRILIGIIFVATLFLIFFNLPAQVKINDKSVFPSQINFNVGGIQIQKKIDYKLGLDLQGGTRIVYQLDMANISEQEREYAFEGARTVIDRRINFSGVNEPSIQTLKIGNDYRIIVELPGLAEAKEALDRIGRTTELTFWEQGPESDASASADLPLGLEFFLGNNPIKTPLSGKDLKAAQIVFDPNTSAPQIQLKFTPQGTKLFGQITSRNVGKPVAIVLDNEVIQAPIVQQEILTGDAVITGSGDVKEAKLVVDNLNSGALPAPMKAISQNTVGPSLGIDSLLKSLFAGILGFITIIIFMSYIYKKEGVLASIALIIYVVITLSIFKFIPITLTLAGIAGFILSIGMAVDANILIFERMREELRQGRSKEVAIRLGFSRAWTSIRDSNISSLITCVILYYFGSGMVRGFALALGIGIIVSMFSAIVITRGLLQAFDKKG